MEGSVLVPILQTMQLRFLELNYTSAVTHLGSGWSETQTYSCLIPIIKISSSSYEWPLAYAQELIYPVAINTVNSLTVDTPHGDLSLLENTCIGKPLSRNKWAIR